MSCNGGPGCDCFNRKAKDTMVYISRDGSSDSLYQAPNGLLTGEAVSGSDGMATQIINKEKLSIDSNSMAQVGEFASKLAVFNAAIYGMDGKPGLNENLIFSAMDLAYMMGLGSMWNDWLISKMPANSNPEMTKMFVQALTEWSTLAVGSVGGKMTKLVDRRIHVSLAADAAAVIGGDAYKYIAKKVSESTIA